MATGATGQWQAGWTGGPPAVSGWEKFQLISVGAMQKESQNLKLVIRNDVMDGKSAAEALAEVKIGTVPNSTWSQVLYACAAHVGVEDPESLNVVPLAPAVTIQSLQSGDLGAGVHAHHVVTALEIGRTAVLDGFTITGGYADGLSPTLNDVGGGLLVVDASPTIRRSPPASTRSA